MKLRITILKYHSWYLCQISLLIMLLPMLTEQFHAHGLVESWGPWDWRPWKLLHGCTILFLSLARFSKELRRNKLWMLFWYTNRQQFSMAYTLIETTAKYQCSILCSETTRLPLMVSLGSSWVLNILTSFLFMVYENVDVEKWSCVC